MGEDQMVRFETGDLVAFPRDAFLYGTEDVLRLELTRVPNPVHWVVCEYAYVHGFPVDERGERTGASERRAVLIAQRVAGRRHVFGKARRGDGD